MDARIYALRKQVAVEFIAAVQNCESCRRQMMIGRTEKDILENVSIP